MAKKSFQLNRAGVRQLMKSDEMQQIVKDYAYEAQSRLSKGYSVNYRKGKTRANAEIVAESASAKRDNLKNNSILKALK